MNEAIINGGPPTETKFTKWSVSRKRLRTELQCSKLYPAINRLSRAQPYRPIQAGPEGSCKSDEFSFGERIPIYVVQHIIFLTDRGLGSLLLFRCDRLKIGD